jgi:hypothetical protein
MLRRARRLLCPNYASVIVSWCRAVKLLPDSKYSSAPFDVFFRAAGERLMSSTA